MNTENADKQQYEFHGGPLNGQTQPRPTMGRTPTALDGDGNVVRVDRADQAIGLMARTNKPAALYLRLDIEGDHIIYAWITSASLVTALDEDAFL